ncbi:IS5 family transposase [Planctomycetota bacterium]|nr:IS5 family transposase [Planctomycetota bacterium]
MERRSSEPGLIDGLTADLGGAKTSSFLDKVQKAIDFKTLANGLREDLTPKQPKGGRPFWPVEVMVKCLMLAKWYSLSDPQLEEQLCDRLSFRRFVGLSLSDATPDETTFVRFRQRLRETGHGSTLFDSVLKQLQNKGLVLKEGSLVDATIITQSTGGKNKDGDSTRDRSASFTKKHGKTYHGYKASINASTDGFITDYRLDTAKVHDSQHIDELIEDEAVAVYADSAYMSKLRRKSLKNKGIFDGIIQRRVRGQKQLSVEQQRHNKACSQVRAKVEHPFAWLKQQMGYRRVRYRGLLRNGLDFGLIAAAYNIKRSLSGLGMGLS